MLQHGFKELRTVFIDTKDGKAILYFIFSFGRNSKSKHVTATKQLMYHRAEEYIDIISIHVMKLDIVLDFGCYNTARIIFSRFERLNNSTVMSFSELNRLF